MAAGRKRYLALCGKTNGMLCGGEYKAWESLQKIGKCDKIQCGREGGKMGRKK